jgi:hypothetical protein
LFLHRTVFALSKIIAPCTFLGSAPTIAIRLEFYKEMLLLLQLGSVTPLPDECSGTVPPPTVISGTTVASHPSSGDFFVSRACTPQMLTVVNSLFINLDTHDTHIGQDDDDMTLNWDKFGGAIGLIYKSWDFNASFDGTRFINCSAERGGAIYADGASGIVITTCHFEKCKVDQFGAACTFNNCKNVRIERTNFWSGNQARAGSAGSSTISSILCCDKCHVVTLKVLAFVNGELNKTAEEPGGSQNCGIVYLAVTVKEESYQWFLDDICFVHNLTTYDPPYAIILSNQPGETPPTGVVYIKNIYLSSALKNKVCYNHLNTTIKPIYERVRHDNEICPIPPTARFAMSNTLHPTNPFPKSASFQVSKPFTRSQSFTPSTTPTPSPPFTASKAFSASLKLSPTEFLATGPLASSAVLVSSCSINNSDGFEVTEAFNETQAVNSSNYVNQSHAIPSAHCFTGTGGYNQSGPFMASAPQPTPMESPQPTEAATPTESPPSPSASEPATGFPASTPKTMSATEAASATDEPAAEQQQADMVGTYAGIGVGALLLLLIIAALIAHALHKVGPAFRKPLDDWSVGEVELA